MTILMLASATPHSSLTHRILSLGRELATRGHDVTIMAPRADKYSKFRPDMPASIDGVNFVYPYQFRTRSFLFNLIPYILAAAVMVLRRPADVVYLYKPTPATIVGLLAKWFKRTPVVTDMDDLGSEVMQIEGQSAVIYRLVAFCERLATRQAKALVVASRLLEREHSRTKAAKPILRLPNGVNPAAFTVKPSDHAVRLVFFGALGRTRLLAPVIEALPQVIAAVGATAVHLEVLGDGPSRPELEALARTTGVAGHVHFRGWTTFDQLPSYLAAGDIGLCIMPAERTTAACSNQKVFQYFALGLAPIVTSVGDLPLYVADGEAGLIVPAGDTTALAEAITRLIQHPEQRQALATRGRQLAETTYNWQTLAGQLETLLQEIAQ